MLNENKSIKEEIAFKVITVNRFTQSKKKKNLTESNRQNKEKNTSDIF